MQTSPNPRRPSQTVCPSRERWHHAQLGAAKVPDYITDRRHLPRLPIVLGLLCVLLGGCSPGIRWRGLSFEPVLAEAQRDQKLTFVYFRHWAAVACTDFEENVLKNPTVLQELRPNGAFYCVTLQFTWDRPLAQQWAIETPPAVVILDPAEHVLSSLSREISVEQLLQAIRAAKDKFPAATQPARAP